MFLYSPKPQEAPNVHAETSAARRSPSHANQSCLPVCCCCSGGFWDTCGEEGRLCWGFSAQQQWTHCASRRKSPGAAPALRKFTMSCRKQQERLRAPASASAVEQAIMLPGSWSYISPAGRAAALRDRQDSKQLTSLLSWHASSCAGAGRTRRTGCACVRGCFMACCCRTERERERERESLAWMRRVKKRELDSVIELKSLIGIADD